MAKTLAELRAMHANMTADANTESANNKNDWITFDFGSNIIRFLPGKDDPLHFFEEGAIHRYEIPSEKFARNYKCRRPSGESCPICDLHWDFWKKHKELDLGKDATGKNIPSKYGDLATKLKQKPRYYAVAVSRKIQDLGEGDPVKMVAMSKQLFDRVMKSLVSDDFMDEGDPDNTTIVSLDRGNDFDVILSKKGNWNSFEDSMAKFKKTKAGTPMQIAEWMDHTHDLKALVVPDSFEDGQRIAAELEATLEAVRVESTTGTGESGEIKV